MIGCNGIFSCDMTAQAKRRQAVQQCCRLQIIGLCCGLRPWLSLGGFTRVECRANVIQLLNVLKGCRSTLLVPVILIMCKC